MLTTHFYKSHKMTNKKQLDSLKEYCNIWTLNVKVGKGKVVIFSKCIISKNIVFVHSIITLFSK